MKILILNGDARPGNTPLTEYLAKFEAGLRAGKADVRRTDLAALDIRFCTGCWSCWWATPGRCAFRDGMEPIYPAFLESDLVVWAAPLVLGTVPALVKKTQDRLIPLIHPYIELVEGECHHRKRYERYPELGLVLEPGVEDGRSDLDGARRLLERFALNFRSRLAFFGVTDGNPGEAAREALAA